MCLGMGKHFELAYFDEFILCRLILMFLHLCLFGIFRINRLVDSVKLPTALRIVWAFKAFFI